MHLSSQADTIYAIATPPGIGALAIIRLSGKDAFSITNLIFETKSGKRKDFENVKPYTIHFGNILLNGKTLDEVLISVFKGPNSFTGEDTIEISTHGSPYIQQELLKLLSNLGARSAEPGEFTLRAYLNSKIDLAQAEAIADLIDAQSEAAVLGAARSLQGIFSESINDLIEEITQLRILVESTLDFPEEEIEFLENAQAHERLAAVKEKLQSLRSEAKQGKILRDGIQLVLAGAPNVGKSSLLNRLAGEEVAIVTPVAGTTRDRVKESITIEGVPMHIIDTAGLRETNDLVEAKGIERSWDAIRLADLVIFLTDPNSAEDGLKEQILRELPPKCPVIEVLNKSDLMASGSLSGLKDAIRISAKTGDGIEPLKQHVLQMVGWNSSQEGAIVARRRHLDCLERASEHIARSEQFAANGNNSLELFAEELFLAQNHLGQITGKLLPDDLLGKIFSQFCIGK
jgi:tRNA modification GTPase